MERILVRYDHYTIFYILYNRVLIAMFVFCFQLENHDVPKFNYELVSELFFVSLLAHYGNIPIQMVPLQFYGPQGQVQYLAFPRGVEFCYSGALGDILNHAVSTAHLQLPLTPTESAGAQRFLETYLCTHWTDVSAHFFAIDKLFDNYVYYRHTIGFYLILFKNMIINWLLINGVDGKIITRNTKVKIDNDIEPDTKINFDIRSNQEKLFNIIIMCTKLHRCFVGTHIQEKMIDNPVTLMGLITDLFIAHNIVKDCTQREYQYNIRFIARNLVQNKQRVQELFQPDKPTVVPTIPPNTKFDQLPSDILIKFYWHLALKYNCPLHHIRLIFSETKTIYKHKSVRQTRGEYETKTGDTTTIRINNSDYNEVSYETNFAVSYDSTLITDGSVYSKFFIPTKYILNAIIVSDYHLHPDLTKYLSNYIAMQDSKPSNLPSNLMELFPMHISEAERLATFCATQPSNPTMKIDNNNLMSMKRISNKNKQSTTWDALDFAKHYSSDIFKDTRKYKRRVNDLIDTLWLYCINKSIGLDELQCQIKTIIEFIWVNDECNNDIESVTYKCQLLELLQDLLKYVNDTKLSSSLPSASNNINRFINKLFIFGYHKCDQLNISRGILDIRKCNYLYAMIQISRMIDMQYTNRYLSTVAKNRKRGSSSGIINRKRPKQPKPDTNARTSSTENSMLAYIHLQQFQDTKLYRLICPSRLEYCLYRICAPSITQLFPKHDNHNGFSMVLCYDSKPKCAEYDKTELELWHHIVYNLTSWTDTNTITAELGPMADKCHTQLIPNTVGLEGIIHNTVKSSIAPNGKALYRYFIICTGLRCTFTETSGEPELSISFASNRDEADIIVLYRAKYVIVSVCGHWIQNILLCY